MNDQDDRKDRCTKHINEAYDRVSINFKGTIKLKIMKGLIVSKRTGNLLNFELTRIINSKSTNDKFKHGELAKKIVRAYPYSIKE